MSDKQLILDADLRAPETTTLDESSEAIAILVAIRRGEAAADACQVITHEEVKQKSAIWTTK